MKIYRLDELPNGMLFQTRGGIRAFKTEYRYPNGGIQCVLLESGEYAHFAADPVAHNETEVICIPMPRARKWP